MSTLRVDRITPFQSSSVQIDGDVTMPGAVTTASFNEYTSSNDERVGSLEATTSSFDTSIGALNSFTQSQEAFNTSATASIEELLAFSSSLEGGYVSEAELAAATGALETSIATKLDSSSFNDYTSSTDGRLDSLESATSSLESSIATKLDSSSFNSYTSSTDGRLDSLESATSSLETSVGELNSFTSSQEVLNTTFATTGSNSFEGEQTINGTFTASLQEGYAWVGNASGVTEAVATSSFGGGGGSVDTSSLATTGSNSFEGNQSVNGDVLVTGSVLLNSGSLSGSVISNLTDTYDGVPEVDYIITLTSASYAELVASASVDVNTLYVISDESTVTDTSFNAYTASQEALNTTFATTGSNSFKGSQQINIEDESNYAITILNQTANPSSIQFGSWVGDDSSVWMGTEEDAPFNFYLNGANDTYDAKIIMKQDGSMLMSGSLTASLQEGYTWVGNASGVTEAVATSSFGGGGGGGSVDTGSFATTGSNTFVGNQDFQAASVVISGTPESSPNNVALRIGNSANNNIHLIEIQQFPPQASLPNPEEHLFKFAVSGSDAGNRTVWFSNGFNWQKVAFQPTAVESLIFTNGENGTGTALPLTPVVGVNKQIFIPSACGPWVRPLDGAGYPIYNLTGSVTLEIGGPDSGSGALSGSATESIANNFSSVQFNVGIDATGSYELTASFAGATVASGLIYIVDAPTAIGFTNQPPSSVVVGNSFSVNVAWDHPSGSLGQVYTPESITLTLTGPDSGSGTLSGDTTLTVNGCDAQVNFNNLSIAPTGTYTITATGDTTSLTVESNEFTVTSE